MSSTQEGNTIVIPIEVLQTNKEEIKQIIAEIQKAKNDLNEMQQETRTGPATTTDNSKVPLAKSTSKGSKTKSGTKTKLGSGLEPTDDPASDIGSSLDDEEEDTASEDSGSLLEGVTVEGAVSKASSAVASPFGFGLGLAEGAIPELAAVIGTGTAGWEMASKLIDTIYGPGGWKDPRWKRAMDTEQEGYFSQQDQQMRRIGLEQVIAVSTGGFKAVNGALVENTEREAALNGVTRIGLQTRASGVRPSP